MNNVLENSALPQNIRKHLQAQNLSAAELERRTGIPHAVVNILHGRSKNPSFKTVHAIAQQLGCTVEELLHTNTITEAKTTPNTFSNQTAANTVWHAQLYQHTVTTVLECVQQHALQPSLPWLHDIITEAYTYALGSPEMQCDSRFIRWLIEKKL